MKKIFLLFLSSLILAGCISVTNTTNSSSVSSSDSSSSVISQSSVLNFTVKDVDGNDVNLADYQGKKFISIFGPPGAVLVSEKSQN